MTVTQTVFEPDANSLTGPIGDHHHARFSDQGGALLVHFATAPKDMEAVHHQSRLEVQARRRGWSLLAIVAEDGHDFRADPVIAFFDKCADGAVFDRFDDVIFYGDDDGGFAALCFGLAAPDARIVAVAPKAPEAELGARYRPTSANLAVAADVVWLHDPIMPDAVPPVQGAQVLITRFIAPDAEARLLRYQAFWPLLDGVMAGQVDRTTVFQRLRARREDRAHIRRLIRICLDRDQFARAAMITGAFAKASGIPRFRKSYNDMIETHDLKGFAPL